MTRLVLVHIHPKNTHVIVKLDYVLTIRGTVLGAIVKTIGRGFVTTEREIQIYVDLP